MYYTPLNERSLDMATVAERTGALPITLQPHNLSVRGYDFDPKEVNNEERDFIFRSLFPIGLDAFVQEPSEEMERDIYEHLFSADHLVVMRSDGTFHFGRCEIGQPRPIAFRMWKNYQVNGKKALYLAGMCVHPLWQGRGIGQQLTRYAIEKEKPSVVFTVTQNPVMKMCMDKATGVEASPRSCNWLENNTAYAETLGKASIYDPATQVLAGNYGGSLYGRLPVSRHGKYNSLFDRLDREAGDAYLLVARLS
jgi:GNAT superfamily N-acetyltransferase